MAMTMKKPSRQELSFAKFSNACRSKGIGFSRKKKELVDLCHALPGMGTCCPEHCPRIGKE